MNEVAGVVVMIIVVVVVSSSQWYAMGRRSTTVQLVRLLDLLDCETKARRAVVGTASSKQASSEHRPKMRAD